MTVVHVQFGGPKDRDDRSALWVFHADFYDGDAATAVCSIDRSGIDDMPEATRKRVYADLMIRAAQALIRDAEELDPQLGKPFAIIRLHERGVSTTTVTNLTMAATEAEIAAKIVEAWNALISVRRGMK